MDKRLEQFIKLLEQTEFHYRSLLPIIDEEKQAAIHSDIDRLTAASCEKQGIIDQIKRLDQQLMVSARHLAMHFEVTGEQLKLSMLSAKMPPAYADKVKQLNEKLKDVVKQVQTSNEQCSSLMQHCMRLVQNSLGYFRHWMGGSDIYAATGNIRANGSSGRHLMSGTV